MQSCVPRIWRLLLLGSTFLLLIGSYTIWDNLYLSDATDFAPESVGQDIVVKFRQFLTDHGPLATEVRENVPVLSYQKAVIIIGYYRSGSTFTGNFFQSFNGTFYVFEPLHTLRHIMDSQGERAIIWYLGNVSRHYNANIQDDILMEEIKNFLSCRFDKLSFPTLKDKFTHEFSAQMDKFYKCYQGNETLLHNCLVSARKACLEAPLVTIKFIRLSMKNAVKLLPLFPNLHIVHLVRDARGIVNSKRLANITENVTHLCNNIYEDLSLTLSQIRENPRRVTLLRYEDFAEKPIETGEYLAGFAGLEFTKTIKDYLISVTSAKNDTCPLCVERKDSKATANKWRMQLNHVNASWAFKQCSKSNKLLRYKAFSSEKEMRNLTVDSKESLPRSLLIT